MSSLMSLGSRPQRKTVEAYARVRALLREMRDGGFFADYQTVATRSKVSRRFLYNHPDLVAEIDAVNAEGRQHLVTKAKNPNNPLSRDAKDMEDALRRLLWALGWRDLEPLDIAKLSDLEVRDLVDARIAPSPAHLSRGQSQ